MVSILDSIKQMHGIDSRDISFDAELIMHINGALMVMTQLGAGPDQRVLDYIFDRDMGGISRGEKRFKSCVHRCLSSSASRF